MVSRLPRRAVLPALGLVGLALVVAAPLTFGAGGLLGGGGARVVPTGGTGAPICLLGCPAVRPSTAPASASAPTPATTAPPSARASASAPSRPPGPARPNAGGPVQTVTPGTGGPQPDQPIPQQVDQVTNGLPILPTLPLGVPPIVPPGAPS